jgi:hypothetical protein
VSRRAIIPESDLRRCAKVSLEVGVSIQARVGADGSISYSFDPPIVRNLGNHDALDTAMDRFLTQ